MGLWERTNITCSGQVYITNHSSKRRRVFKTHHNLSMISFMTLGLCPWVDQLWPIISSSRWMTYHSHSSSSTLNGYLVHRWICIKYTWLRDWSRMWIVKLVGVRVRAKWEIGKLVMRDLEWCWNLHLMWQNWAIHKLGHWSQKGWPGIKRKSATWSKDGHY